MKKRKILYISGTRADYGLMKKVLCSIRKHPALTVEIGVTGMHLMPEFGWTINEIKKDKFEIQRIEAVYKRDDKKSTLEFLSRFTFELTGKIGKIKPDIILLLGDRAEMLGAAMVGAYLGVPAAHIHGGEVTLTLDEITRHAITKLSHIHFAANKNAAERIVKLGEDRWRVFIVGAPGLDNILNRKLVSKKEVAEKYKLDLSKPILLIIQHPVTSGISNPGGEMRQTMEAVRTLGYQTVVIYPNADPGGRKMIKVIEKYRRHSFIRIYKNLPREDYVDLMKIAAVMAGNSSSGIIEAPAVHLPVINIGRREGKRLQADNLIEVDCQSGQIEKAVHKAINDRKFREKVRKCKSPYGDGNTAPRIARILSRIEINEKLLQKQIAY